MAHRTSHRFPHACIAILTAALAIACSRNDAVNNDRKVQAGGERGTNQRIKVEGCLQEAPGAPGEEYLLAHVTMPEPEAQPQGQETMEHRIITPGSWVRLSPGAEDLKTYVGKRVAVMGEVVDTGRNTIGTSGHKTDDTREKFERATRDSGSNPERAAPPSTVPPASADANGNAPRIAVEKVDKVEGECEAQRNVPVGR